jgi:tryptophan-rich hypothetical protein
VSGAIFQKSAPPISKMQTMYLHLRQGHFIVPPKIISARSSNNMNRISPKKLLLSKWTAVHPIGKQKHFLVSKVTLPEDPQQRIELIEIEAVYSKKTKQIYWRELSDSDHWIQGWK